MFALTVIAQADDERAQLTASSLKNSGKSSSGSGGGSRLKTKSNFNRHVVEAGHEDDDVQIGGDVVDHSDSPNPLINSAKSAR